MTVSRLLGDVAVAMLKEDLGGEAGGAGTGRFALNLNAEHATAVAEAVLGDPFLSERIEIRLPARHFGGRGLPDDVLTDLPATYFRNAACSKSAFLLAEVEHDEGASFNEIARLGAAELMDRLDHWVRIVSVGLGLPEAQAKWWERNLAGLRDLRVASIDRFAAYALATRDAVLEGGHPLIHAFGHALPALKLPRDTFFFNAVKERSRGYASEWRRQFAALRKRRAGLLLKQGPSQLLLGEDDLRASFEKVRDVIPEARHAAVERFVAAPAGWNGQAADLAECEWEEIKPLFDGLSRERFNLGKATLELYEELEPGRLSDEEREYLGRLIDRKTTEPSEEDVSFYEDHRDDLKDDRRLKSAWDRFVYGRAIETDDFLCGLAAALEPLFNRSPAGTRRRLRVRCDLASKRDFRNLNVEAGLYFALRYAGCRRLFGSDVEWEVGELFEFPTLVDGWNAAKRPLNRSSSKSAMQLRFLVELETETAGGLHPVSIQLIWRFDANAVSSQLVDDWERIGRHPFTECRTMREFATAKVRERAVDLSDVRTFVPAYDRDRGSFVPAWKPKDDLATRWRNALRSCLQDGRLASADAEALEGAFERFAAIYSTALTDFHRHGSGSRPAFDQLRAFADLLTLLSDVARGDRNRQALLKPLLQLGVVVVGGGAPAAIVAPWHPMRLGAAWRKAHLVADLVRRLLTSEQTVSGDARLFFRDLERDLRHPLYPEVVAAWSGASPQLLAVTDTVRDYSLYEAPVSGAAGTENVNENPTEGGACVLDLVRRYLALHPHERANMSVVLYNCDSVRLPQEVIERVGAMQDDDEDFRCEVLLRHTDGARLRNAYSSILGAEIGADDYSPSEATWDFMARLRISVVTDPVSPPDPKDGAPYDIVFSQDVISRRARLEWLPERAEPADFAELLPSRWSRRRPAAADDLKSAVHLCCPVQSAEGWAYLDAVASVFRGDRDRHDPRRLLPTRQLDFADEATSRFLAETHDLGNWVANFDELLDRRQLLNHDVRVIRYKQTATQGRNLVVSSSAPLGLLRSMIVRRLVDLGLDMEGVDARSLAEMLVKDANDVSGDIVLRAAKRGRSASELIGLVLSRHLVRERLGRDELAGWYFLDDYAAWMGQREEQLADLLAISPRMGPDGVLRVAMVVSEAKYVELDGLASKRRESQKQLRDTLRRIEEALFADPPRLDRDSWLARLADLMLDGVRVPATSSVDIGEWRRAMREGRCEIALEGWSHVFVPTSSDGPDPTEVTEVPGVDDARQEIYGRPLLKRLLQAYRRGEDTAGIRRSMGADASHDVRRWRRIGSGTERSGIDPSDAVEAATPPPAASLPRATDDDMTSVGSASPPTDADGVGGNADRPDPGPPAATADPTGHGRETDEDRSWLSGITSATRSALQQLQLQAKLTGATLTPNSALLRFAGSANLTVDQVTRKRSELLTTFGLNVISVRPEPGAVVLAVERPGRKVVGVEELWRGWRPEGGRWGNRDLLIAVRESDGGPLFLSPGAGHAPHTLIAGSTGSGKSVLMQNIILGIAATNTPEQARILLVDPKQGVDFFAFEDLPHLDGGIVDDQETAASRLTGLVAEMDRRYVLLKSSRSPNFTDYNAKVSPGERLPVIWVIHDEFAEWMLADDYREAVSNVVKRLGLKARAAGIHLVFAAQRPDAHVMPPQLRDNLGNRLILRVESEGTSEIALGQPGAERLLGKGHLLAKLEGERDLVFAQVPFVTGAFVDAVVRNAATSANRPAASY